MNNLPFQFRIQRDLSFGSDTFPIHLYARMPDGRIAIPEAAITMRVFEPGAEALTSEPLLNVGKEALQSLIDELWHLGIRPTEGHGSTGQLAATEKHLDHTTRLLDQTLQTVLNVANASLLTQHGLKPAE
jgi:hypothetical protein